MKTWPTECVACCLIFNMSRFSDPHTGADDKCAETYTAWYSRCFAQLSGDNAPAGMQETMQLFGDQLSEFNEMCTQLLQPPGGGH